MIKYIVNLEEVKRVVNGLRKSSLTDFMERTRITCGTLTVGNKFYCYVVHYYDLDFDLKKRKRLERYEGFVNADGECVLGSDYKIIDYQKRNYETIEKFYESMEKDMSALVKGEQNV